MVFSHFAGPVFTSQDLPKLLLLVVVIAAPFIFGIVALGLGIRDMVQKKVHRSTIIAFAGAVIIFLFDHFILGRFL